MVMGEHSKHWIAQPSLEDIVNVDTWSRSAVDAAVQRMQSVHV